jgi:hypothetical protein
MSVRGTARSKTRKVAASKAPSTDPPNRFGG